jgi:signal transduction histidine kinase
MSPSMQRMSSGRLLDPTDIKSANRLVHELTYDDLYLAISLLENENQSEAKVWESVVTLLTDRVDATKWNGDMISESVTADCLLKRNK